MANQMQRRSLGDMKRVKLRDMKRDKKEKTEDMPKMVSSGDDYSWGLRLRLDQHELKKLGIELPQIGQVFDVHAVGTVTNVSEDANELRKSQHVEIQLKKLGLSAKTPGKR